MRRATGLVPRLLIGVGLLAVLLLLVAPLAVILGKTFAHGWHAVVVNLQHREMLHAIQLSALVIAISVPVNITFGILLAWCVTRFDFFGRRLLAALIDIPFAMSPIVAGLCYLLLYGSQSPVGQWFSAYGVQLMFAWPGIAMVTLFVTSPYVARVLIPLMQEQGSDEEEAATVLGAGGWQLFRRITLPNIRWALLYGAMLTSARAAGEFGAVSVVSGLIRGQTLTLPLQVEMLHQDYNSVGAFTAATLLSLLALITLLAKTLIEYRQKQKLRSTILAGPVV